MFAITGITGKVGGELARNLLASKQPVRAVLRDATPFLARSLARSSEHAPSSVEACAHQFIIGSTLRGKLTAGNTSKALQTILCAGESSVAGTPNVPL
jgi:hypothetical protein